MRKLVRCYGCDALVKDIPGKPHKYIGASAGCWAIYGEILAKEYGTYGYPEPTHRLTVDTYAVQHPGKLNRQSIQSVNVHLISLYLILEQGANGQAATKAIGQILKNADKCVWLEPPVPNGNITVLDVVKAQNLAEHKRFVEEWARDVWEAWSPHHAWIQHLVKRYLR